MLGQIRNDDPCSRVTSPAEAVEYAEVLLTTSGKPGSEVWAAAAVGPLAGLLYAASPCGNNEGMRWLVQATAAVPNRAVRDSARARAARRWVPSWDSALAHLTEQPRLSQALRNALRLEPHQRNCVVMTIREALSPWIQSESRVDSE